MLHFFYESLDTLKKVKKPTRKEVRVFTGQVFVVVIVSSILFFIFDNIRGNLYQQIFATFGTPTVSVGTQQPIDVNTLQLPAVPTADVPSDSVGDTEAVVVDAPEGDANIVDGNQPAEEVIPDQEVPVQ